MKSENPLLSDYAKTGLDFLRSERKKRLNHIAENDYWGVDNQYRNSEYFSSYDSSFNGLLRGITFDDMLKKRKEDGKSTHVLDVFGSGGFLNSYNAVDSLTGIRLLPKKSRGIDIPSYEVVGGNAYSGATWQYLTSQMHERNITSFDLITCRPINPFGSTHGEQKVATLMGASAIYERMFMRAYNLLSSDNGYIFAQLPVNVSWLLMKEFCDTLQEKNISVNAEYYSDEKVISKFMITKTPNSPQYL